MNFQVASFLASSCDVKTNIAPPAGMRTSFSPQAGAVTVTTSNLALD